MKKKGRRRKEEGLSEQEKERVQSLGRFCTFLSAVLSEKYNRQPCVLVYCQPQNKQCPILENINTYTASNYTLVLHQLLSLRAGTASSTLLQL